MTPEMKERLSPAAQRTWEKVKEMIADVEPESCCEDEKCVCPDDREYDDWLDDGPDPDYEFERRWDDGEGR
jgi:hypothetical protein